MGYYSPSMGDYATGGYAGDPGWLSKIWKFAKPLLKFVPGPIGLIAKAAAIAGGGIAAAKYLAPPQFPVAQTQAFPLSPSGQMTRFAPGRAATFGQGALPSAMMPGVTGAEGACPVGYHLRKDKRLPAKCVRNRRMNVANPRALRRGMRRVQGFEKLARRTITFTRRTRLKKRKT